MSWASLRPTSPFPHDQAEAWIAGALAAGGHLVSEAHAPMWWVLADPEGNEGSQCRALQADLLVAGISGRSSTPERLYLSATLGDVGELECAFGRTGVFQLTLPPRLPSPAGPPSTASQPSPDVTPAIEDR